MNGISMNQRKIEEIAWNSWNHLVFRLRPFQQNFILFRISLYCLASDEHAKKRKGFSSWIQIFEAIRTNDDLEMRQKRIKSLRCGSLFLDNLSESSMLTSRNTSMQSYKIRFIRDWKFTGALHSPMASLKFKLTIPSIERSVFNTLRLQTNLRESCFKIYIREIFRIPKHIDYFIWAIQWRVVTLFNTIESSISQNSASLLFFRFYKEKLCPIRWLASPDSLVLTVSERRLLGHQVNWKKLYSGRWGGLLSLSIPIS